MRVLLIRMSSLSDIFHTFPALSDLQRVRPDVRLDWVVEADLAEAAAWHPAAERIIPVTLNDWLCHRDYASWRAFRGWRANLRQQSYDLVIDAQGLLKSALIARQADAAEHHGFDQRATRQTLAAWLTDIRHPVGPTQHAIARTRQLFAQTLDYTLPISLDFGIRDHFTPAPGKPQIVLIPGSTWQSRLWAEQHWVALTRLAVAAGYTVELLWGNAEEEARARRISQTSGQQAAIHVAPRRHSITEVAAKLAAARAVVGTATGFTHLAAALNTPVVGLFGPNSVDHTGLHGPHARHMQAPLPCVPCQQRHCRLLARQSSAAAPCMAQLQPEDVWQQVILHIAPLRRRATDRPSPRLDAMAH
ncbi:lipopolysaccharide heptosyltransferase I [Alcanivorax sp. JB21]|uniref:lipopolysaccharide heptosyltransferase I n=1 Tax=Alcanivorax limicola TaxID=2874102 RepID=UPI001CBE5267|nr:lipopolysaccharide heptosyltransferase I [Alcanivorax limicola]MBZ2190005.1 lipopolysaccharide heptosyltransferase I [Alcanivorax limicola]